MTSYTIDEIIAQRALSQEYHRKFYNADWSRQKKKKEKENPDDPSVYATTSCEEQDDRTN